MNAQHIGLGALLLAWACCAGAQSLDAPKAEPKPGAAAGPGSLKDAVELCDRLAGTERKVCLQQAQENRERAATPPVGASPGAGAEQPVPPASPGARPAK